MAGKFISDGLGGFYGVSHSLKLGAKLKMNIVFIFYLTLPFIILHTYDPGIFTMSSEIMNLTNRSSIHITTLNHFHMRPTLISSVTFVNYSLDLSYSLFVFDS